MNIRSSNVIITGASRGIGWSLAQSMAQRGAHLHLVSRSQPDQMESLKELGAPSVRFWPADLSDRSDLERFVTEFQTDHEVDILVNNAGQLTGGLIEKQSLNDIEKMLRVNLEATISLTRLFLPRMLERKRGKIVNNSSVSGKMFFPLASTYAASKAGVVAFTESIKQELRGTGVSTLLVITPGIKTEMFDKIYKLYGEHMDLDFLSSIPPEEWTERICKEIEADSDTCEPKGTSQIGSFIAQHAPGLFQKLVAKKFRRH